jgi:hypothetical protein
MVATVISMSRRASLLGATPKHWQSPREGTWPALPVERNNNSSINQSILTGADALNGFWIGLTDQAREGQFIWTTGEPYVEDRQNWDPWGSNQPDNLRNAQDHVRINYQASATNKGKWEDTSGDSAFPAILEFEQFDPSIYVGASRNSIIGNLIGTDVTGKIPLANAGDGVQIVNSPRNIIGRPHESRRNIISGNSEHGIRLDGRFATENKIQGNWIGIGADGETRMGNMRNGVSLTSAPNNLIGGDEPNSGNVISGNGTADSGSQSNGIALRALAYGPIYEWPINAGGNGHAYVTVQGDANAPLSWDDAERLAVSAGGHLVSITSKPEEDFIRHRILVGENVRSFWIGLNDRETEGDWKWTSGEPYVFSNWRVGEPTNLKDEDIVHTWGDGTWDDASHPSDFAILEFNTVDAANLIGTTDNSKNHILGNFIGTNASGTKVIENAQNGITIEHGLDNTIGSSKSGNVIAGNIEHGIHLAGFTKGTSVAGNWIGTNKNGTTQLGNGLNGVAILDSSSNNRIGGEDDSERNVIAFNGHSGVRIDSELDRPLISTFDTTAEGWTATDNVIKPGGGIPVTYVPNDGRPGGHISTTNRSNSNTNFWQAPNKFLGDRSDSYGTFIRYDVKQSRVSAQVDEPELILETVAGLRLYYNTMSVPRVNE